jgi:hypothetical protein
MGAGRRVPPTSNVSSRVRRRRHRRATRLIALTLFASMAMLIWAPAAGASSLYTQWPSLSLNLRSLFGLSRHAPAPPRQLRGTATGLHHQAPARVTRAHGHAHGTRPRRGAGQLPEYAAHKATYATKVVTGEDPHTGGFVAGHSKLMAGSMTATTDTFQNPDGSVSRQVFAAPVNFKDSAGTFEAIQTGLAAVAGGFAERANSLSVRFGALASDAGLVSVRLAGGQRVQLSLAGAARVRGTAAGAAVTYPDVLAGTSLEQAATTTGVDETLTVTAQSPSQFTFPLAAAGLTAKAGPGGSVDLVAATDGDTPTNCPPQGKPGPVPCGRYPVP